MVNYIQMVRYPIITDKAIRLLENNQYSFIIRIDSNKTKIKNIIEYLFNVKVIKVNICRLPPKQMNVGKSRGWKPKYKKAIVKLAKGDTINLFTQN